MDKKKRSSRDKLFINTNMPDTALESGPKTTREARSNGLEEDMRKLQIRPATVSDRGRRSASATSLSPSNGTTKVSTGDKPSTKQKDGWVSPCGNSDGKDKAQQLSDKAGKDLKPQGSSGGQVVTPTNLAGKEKKSELGTLETMHEQLTRSLMVEPGTALDMGAECAKPDVVKGSQLWVTKWVDYTSKYGLGFLLNNGSAGVYFNDSSKIVLSTNGANFEYYERNRKSKEAKEEKYTLQEYPESLQKKVTLLKHFTNYLVEQQMKTGGDNGGEVKGIVEF